MTEEAASSEPPARAGRPRLQRIILLVECAVVLALAGWWLLAGRQSRLDASLVLFLYCFPSEFLIAPLPHEPVLIYFGRSLPATTVALVSVLGTLLVEALNYNAFGLLADSRRLQGVVRSRWLRRLVGLFRRQPFLALLAGGLLPLPFYPFRCLVVLARYPLWRYLLAVALARAPRFYLLALLGVRLALPDSLFAALTLVLVLAFLAPLAIGSRRTRPRSGEVALAEGGSPGS